MMTDPIEIEAAILAGAERGDPLEMTCAENRIQIVDARALLESDPGFRRDYDCACSRAVLAAIVRTYPQGPRAGNA